MGVGVSDATDIGARVREAGDPDAIPRAGTYPDRVGTRDALLVDDDALMVQLLSRFLESRGWHVRAFTDPRLALASALERVPSVVLTDFAMPALGGDELARALRARLGERAPRLVLITASRLIARDVEALFDAIVDKPFRLERVAATLRELEAPGSHVRLRRPDAAAEDDERETG